MDLHVGCSGWFYSHWRGIFYPPQEVTTKNWFAYYSNVFDTVELNAPFYRSPRPATVRRWSREARPGFVYTVKVNQGITHEKRLIRTDARVRSFYDVVGALNEKLGCFLFQFPPSFHYSSARLQRIVRQLDPRYRNVVEFRHRSWWRPDVYAALTAHHISFCAVSAPRLPEEIPPGQTRLYLRLSGRTRWYQHDYTAVELEAWIQRILQAKPAEAWVYFNNDRNGYAVKNALVFRRLLRAAVNNASC
jgi:uncharacterized protein YecE (DUF72 family)